MMRIHIDPKTSQAGVVPSSFGCLISGIGRCKISIHKMEGCLFSNVQKEAEIVYRNRRSRSSSDVLVFLPPDTLGLNVDDRVQEKSGVAFRLKHIRSDRCRPKMC